MMKNTNKIVLIYPPKIHQVSSQTPDFAHKEAVLYPPLGLLYLAGMLKNNPDFEVKILDCQVNFTGLSDFADIIKLENPNIVGITLMSNLLFAAYELLREIRRINPKIRIIAGGPHASLYSKIVLQSKLVDFVIVGDGEKSFEQLINVLKETLEPKEGHLDKIPGLVYFNENEIIKDNSNYNQGELDLNHLPFPNRKLLDFKLYGNPANKNQQAATILTSRGCPYRCTFCDIPHKKYLFRSAENVVDEMEDILNLGISEINIIDDTFNLNRERVVKICQEILQRQLKFRWIGRGRVYPFDDELAKLLVKAGCYRFHVGVESGTDDILENIGKKITTRQVRDFFSICRRNHLQTLAYFIIGFPGEKETQIEQTISFAIELKPAYVFFSILSLFPGSRIYELAMEKGIVEGDPWLEFSKNPTRNFEIPFWTEYFSKAQLYKLLRDAYRRFYFSPHYLTKKILYALARPNNTMGLIKSGISMLRYVKSKAKGFE